MLTRDEWSDLLARLEQVLDRIETGLLSTLLLGLILLGLADMSWRGLAGQSLPWVGEIMRAIVLWLTMIGATLAASRLRHVRIAILVNRLPSGWLGPLHRILMLITAGVCLVLAWHGLRLAILERDFQGMAFASVPSWVVVVIIPIGFVMMASRFLAHALGDGVDTESKDSTGHADGKSPS